MTKCETQLMFFCEDEKLLNKFIEKIENSVTYGELEHIGRTYEFVAAALRDDVTLQKGLRNGKYCAYISTENSDPIDSYGGVVTHLSSSDGTTIDIDGKSYYCAFIYTEDPHIPNIHFWNQMTESNGEYSAIKFMYASENWNSRIFINSDASREIISNSYAISNCYVPSFIFENGTRFYPSNMAGKRYPLDGDPLDDLNEIIEGLAYAYGNNPEDFADAINVEYLKPKKTLAEAIRALDLALEQYLTDDEFHCSCPAIQLYEYATPTNMADKT